MDEELYDLEMTIVVRSHLLRAPPGQPLAHSSFRMENLTRKQKHEAVNRISADWGNLDLDLQIRNRPPLLP